MDKKEEEGARLIPCQGLAKDLTPPVSFILIVFKSDQTLKKMADGSKGKVVAVGEFVKKIKVHCGGAVRAHQSPPKAGPASARAWPGHRWEVKKKFQWLL